MSNYGRIKSYQVFNILIALVWLINGLVCKIMNLVPRHQQIVARILGEQYASVFTKLIGVSEIVMAIWIVSGYKSKINVYLQVIVIGSMNILEFILVPDLLLWGGWNIVFAFLLILVIIVNEYRIKTLNRTNDKLV